MQVVPNLKGKTIGAFAKQAIFEGATIQTDANPQAEIKIDFGRDVRFS